MTAKEMNAIARWEADHAQDKLTDYSLNQRSIVFDIGGYKGQWTYDLLKRGAGVCEHCGAKQDPYVYIFEPVSAFHAACVIRFDEYPKVKCLNFGLSNFDREAVMYIDEAASGEYGQPDWRPVKPQYKYTADMRDITGFVHEQGITQIDLMSINIEGEEYALLDRMIRSGIAEITENIQVQFHDFMPEARQARADIQSRLAATHVMQWEYPFVWESWRRIN